MNLRLLLIGDPHEDVTLIVESLREYGLELICERVAASECLRAMLHDRQWDAVLCNYDTPRITAETALEIVRSHDEDLPFILVSGAVSAPLALEMMRQGMHEYVTMDELERLGPAIEREIRQSRHRRSEKIAKAELFELQQRFRDTFEQSSVGFAHLDSSARVIWTNRHLAEMLGYDREELVGLPCDRLTWPEDWPEEQQRQRDLLEGKMDEYRVQKRYRRRDGSPIWSLLTLTAIRAENGALAYLSAVVQDITEQKNAEELVRRNENFVRSVLDSLPFQVAVVDREGVIRQVNSTWDEAARNGELASPESVGVGTPYLDVCPDELREQLLKVIEGDSPPIGVEYSSHLSERERWFLMSAAPLEWSDGGAVISHVDITSRVLTEQALERREREYRSIVETMGEGLLSLDLEGRLLFANRRFCEISGYDISELRGRNIVDLLVGAAEQSAVSKQVAKALGGASFAFRTKIRSKDGSERWVDVSTVHRYDSDGRIVGRLSVVSDITEKRASEQEQERLRRQIDELNRIESLGKLAGNMAHEFNNVLMGIHPFTEVIQRLSEGNQKIEQATQFVSDAVQRGRRVSQEVLRFARPTPLERSELAIEHILGQVEQLGRGIVGKDHSLAVEPPAEPWTVSVDREQILQVFTNLMINACDAMSSGGAVTISATRDGSDSRYGFGVVDQPDRYVRLVVSDTGCGMTPDESQKIFEPMYTTKRTGTGLGLAIVHHIMTAHEGYIFVDSRPGEGTSFHLFLPLVGIAAATDTEDPIFAAGTEQ